MERTGRNEEKKANKKRCKVKRGERELKSQVAENLSENADRQNRSKRKNPPHGGCCHGTGFWARKSTAEHRQPALGIDMHTGISFRAHPWTCLIEISRLQQQHSWPLLSLSLKPHLPSQWPYSSESRRQTRLDNSPLPYQQHSCTSHQHIGQWNRRRQCWSHQQARR